MSETGFSGITLAVISAVAAIVGSVGGGYFTFVTQSRELDIRMVDVALTILNAEQKDTDNTPARKFAIELLNKYSGVKIDKPDAERWISAKDSIVSGAWPSLRTFWDNEPIPVKRGIIVELPFPETGAEAHVPDEKLEPPVPDTPEAPAPKVPDAKPGFLVPDSPASPAQ